MKKISATLVSKLHSLSDLPPLIFRLILAYGFYGPAIEKVRHFESTVRWFQDGLQLPFPVVNAVMATSTECLGVVLVLLGLATRIISVPMMVIMLVAIKTVHWPDGFAACESVKSADGVIERVKHGFEIPFYYFWMLFSLLVTGPGRISLDYLIGQKINATSLRQSVR